MSVVFKGTYLHGMKKTKENGSRRVCHPLSDSSNERCGYLVYCPACGFGHFFNVEKPGPNGQQWTFNGNLEKPTFYPSMLILPPAKRCHSFVRNGRIEYLSDCEHKYAGQTLDLEPF